MMYPRENRDEQQLYYVCQVCQAREVAKVRLVSLHLLLVPHACRWVRAFTTTRNSTTGTRLENAQNSLVFTNNVTVVEEALKIAINSYIVVDPTLPRAFNTECAKCGHQEAVFFTNPNKVRAPPRANTHASVRSHV
jgi:hypothetical protein